MLHVLLVSSCDKNTMVLRNLKKKGFIFLYILRGIEFMMAGNEWKRPDREGMEAGADAGQSLVYPHIRTRMRSWSRTIEGCKSSEPTAASGFFFQQVFFLHFKGFIISPNSSTSWGPAIYIHGPMENICCSSHHICNTSPSFFMGFRNPNLDSYNWMSRF